MPETQTIDTDALKAIVVEQARIALVNYDAAQKNHESINKLLEIVVLQSHEVDILIVMLADLLDALEKKG